MTRLVILSAAVAAILSLAGPAGAQPVRVSTPYPTIVIPPVNSPPADSGSAIGSDVNCEPPGLPPSGAGALPPSTHSCQ